MSQTRKIEKKFDEVDILINIFEKKHMWLVDLSDPKKLLQSWKLTFLKDLPLAITKWALKKIFATVLFFLNWGQGRGHGSKLRIWPNKKKIKYQSFTLRKSAFMIYGQFPLRNGLKLRFVFLKIWESHASTGSCHSCRIVTFSDFEKDEPQF